MLLSCLLAGLLAAAACRAQGPADAAAPLPESVQAALREARVAPEGAAFAVLPLDGGALQVARQEAAPMNPASTMKLLTTYAALANLGPDYRWRTTVYASRAPRGGRLDGDLVLRGDGDPSLVIERFWLLLQRLRALGIKDIRGDLVLDRSRFDPSVDAGTSLDHNDLRPYNVAPDALLLNYKALSLDFVPDVQAGVARIVATPRLEGVALPAQVPLAAGACGDWKARLRADFSTARAPRLLGAYPAACEEQTWHLALLGANDYLLAAFRALWREAGGSFHGGVREGRAGPEAVRLAQLDSPPLAEVIRDMNKNSNNVMARQIFLTLGSPRGAAADGETGAEAATTARSIEAVQRWLEREGLAMPELVLQNGSGLSRQERISAAGMARLLAHAWGSAQMPDFLASLPLAGVDGTMKSRKAATGSAYVKTGYLAEVRALAGYVFAASGHRYAIVCFVNDPHAEDAQGAIDEFLRWVWQRG